MTSKPSCTMWAPEVLQALGSVVVDHSAMVCLRCLPTGEILAANEFAEKILGEGLTGRFIKECFLDFQNIPEFSELIKQETPQMLSVQTALGVAQTYYFRFKAVGQQILVLGETHHWEVEKLRLEMVRMNGELSNLTRELSKKQAELTRLNERKNEFLGIAAHDLRGPIANIIGLSELITYQGELRLLPDDLYQLGLIHSLGKSMLVLLNDLLDITAIESGKLSLRIEPCLVQELVRQATSLNRLPATAKQIDLVSSVAPDLPIVRLDGQKMVQVLNNLVANAIKFSPKNSRVELTVSMTPIAVRFSVIDQGPGFQAPPGNFDFKPFSPGAAKPTGGEKSTGLGLAIVQKIVQAHRGKMLVEGTPGKGCTFTVELPLTDGHQG